MELDMVMIGKRIKERRKELHLTQTDIKSAVGISSGNISDIENGNRTPAASTLVLLSQILQCSIDWMLTGVSPIKEENNYSISEELSDNDQKLISSFHDLDERDQREILAIISYKLKASKGATYYNSELDSYKNLA